MIIEPTQEVLHRLWAIAVAMSSGGEEWHRDDDKLVADDGHEHDLVMPGFRFHPTEEELIEFYLRRKVEGKRFNVELITFLDLYRYDPWELPALAAIGEKEWFFYVPRDRKYRNGDRPNRVTTSGYWKATGADRMIRSENSSPIGLKKTLVFYSGKAPKGIRSSWIMNEYRLPQSQTERYKKEISLCRVYKRPSIEDHCHLPSTLSSRPSSSKASDQKRQKTCPSFGTLALDSPSPEPTVKMPSVSYDAPTINPAASLSTAMEAEVAPIATCTAINNELDKIIGYNQGSYLNQPEVRVLSMDPSSQPQLLPVNVLPNSLPAISDKLWEWSSLPAEAAGRDYTTCTDNFK